MMSLPLTVIANFIFALLWLLADRKKAIMPVILIILGCIFLPRTYQFGEKTQESVTSSGKTRTFKVLNYNVYGFWVVPNHARKDDAKTDEMKQWLIGQDADILCMPEFYSDTRLSSFNNVEFFNDNGYKYYNLLSGKNRKGVPFHTLAIFSKYPIIKHKEEAFELQNGLMFADIVVKKDTIRMIGVHLYSMSLRLKSLVTQKEIAGIKRETKTTFSKMKKGFSARASEIKLMETWIRESPYPVIVCGDFNETPYSYFYGQTRSLLKNAFEEKGSGFGFTYNRIPWFIRIDNQFYNDKSLDLLNFTTLGNIRFSDHNPSIGTYSVKREPSEEGK